MLVGQGISSLGNAITNTALPILVLALTGSGIVMGVVGVLTTLPDLVIGLPAGAYADRWDRRRMMLLSDLARGVLTAVIPISVWLDGPTIALVIVVTFPINALRVLWLAAYTAAVPGLVGRAEVPRANALFEAVFNIGWVAGPALAGLLAATIGPGPTIAIDALTFLISGASMLLIRRPLRPEARPAPTRIVADVREGIGFVSRHPTLRAVIALWTMIGVVTAGLVSGLIFYVTIDRGLGPEVAGGVLSAYAVGSMLGALSAARIPFRAVGWTLLGGTIVTGLVLLAVALDVPVAVMIAASFVAGVVNSIMFVLYITLRTLLSPDRLLGRIGATARTLSIGMQPIGVLVAGVLLDLIGGAMTLSAMGVGLIVVAAAFGLVPSVRGARLPTDDPAVPQAA